MAKEELLKWITSGIEKGIPASDLRKSLKDAGYSDDKINKAFKEAGTSESPQAVQKGRALLPLIIAVVIVLSAALAWHLIPREAETAYVVDMSTVGCMLDLFSGENSPGPATAGCTAGDEGWGFYAIFTVKKNFSLPDHLQGRPLKMLIEARGNEVILPDWHYVATYEFSGMTAQKFLDWDRENNPVGLSVKSTLFNSLTNVTIDSVTEQDDWSAEMQPGDLAAMWKEEFQYLGEFDPFFTDSVLENYTIRGNALQMRHRKQDPYNSSYPVFRVTINEEPGLVYLTSEDWEEHTLEFFPQDEEVSLAIEFLNNEVVPSVKDGELDFDNPIADRNFYIRKISIIPVEGE